jgi:hypothetical protein
MIKRQGSWLGTVLVLLTTAAGAAGAQGNHPNDHDHGHGRDPGYHWVFLGQRHVDGKADQDNIEVKPDEGKFRAIQFRVNGGMVRFNKVIVHFRDGSHEELVVRADIAAGERTRAIDLPGNRRMIQRVEMWYEKANWRTRPAINLYGAK